MNVEITRGRVVDPAQDLDRVTRIYVADGTVAALHEAPPRWRAERVIDAHGLVVTRGCASPASSTRRRSRPSWPRRPPEG